MEILGNRGQDLAQFLQIWKYVDYVCIFGEVSRKSDKIEDKIEARICCEERLENAKV